MVCPKEKVRQHYATMCVAPRSLHTRCCMPCICRPRVSLRTGAVSCAWMNVYAVWLVGLPPCVCVCVCMWYLHIPSAGPCVGAFGSVRSLSFLQHLPQCVRGIGIVVKRLWTFECYSHYKAQYDMYEFSSRLCTAVYTSIFASQIN